MIEDDFDVLGMDGGRESGILRKMGELMDAVQKSVREDVKARIKELERENAELSRYRDNADELEEVKRNAQIDAKRARLSELLKPFVVPVWTVEGKWDYIHEKCGLCDENRHRHFTSPCGKAMEERCLCAEEKYIYRVVEIELVDFCMDDNKHIWFRYSRNCCYEELTSVYPYNGEKFERNEYWLFLDRDKAEEYARWLNNQKEA